jgi:predicted Fe-S protein YdhL (DUF1289 family)
MTSGTGDETDDVASPCVRTCCLDDDDVCIGCGRSLPEIIAWNEADPSERRSIVERGRQRLARRLAKTRTP